MKRKVPLKGLSYGVITPAAGSSVRQEITLATGHPDREGARDRQGDQGQQEEGPGVDSRATSCASPARIATRLQEVIALLRSTDFGIDMQFTNYRTN